jgi:hypothetical protein
MKKFLFLFLVALAFVTSGTSDGVVLFAKDKPVHTAKKEITVYVTKTGHKYHRDGCQYLRRSCYAMKLSEARQMYDPCSVCQPPK